MKGHNHGLCKKCEKIHRTQYGKDNPIYGKPAWNRGIPRSEETKRKISLANIGNTHGFKKGHIAWNRGLTKKTDERVKTNAMAISKSIQREKNHHWNYNPTQLTGRSRAVRWFKAKPCAVCDKKAEIHHKDGDTTNNSPNNIEFLCRKHHMERDGRNKRVLANLKQYR